MEVGDGVDRLPSGSYRARLMVDGKTYSVTFATEPEAAEWVVATRDRLGEARAARRLTLGEYARRWLGELIDPAANIDRCRRHALDHILPALGARPLVEGSPAEIATLLEQVEADRSGADADQVRAPLRELSADVVYQRLVARVRCRRRDAPDRPSGLDVYCRPSMDIRNGRPR